MHFLALISSLGCISSAYAVGDVRSTLLSPRYAANPNQIVFDCNVMPQVCRNMCYGMYCAGIGSDLTYDTKDATLKRHRRTNAGCLPSPNRCQQGSYAGGTYQCDEYPFAGTIARNAAQPNRRQNSCVLKAQQLADHVGDPDDDESQYDWMMDNLDIVDNAIVAAM